MSIVVNDFLAKAKQDDYYFCQICGRVGHILPDRISISIVSAAVRAMAEQIREDDGLVQCSECRGQKSVLQIENIKLLEGNNEHS